MSDDTFSPYFICVFDPGATTGYVRFVRWRTTEPFKMSEWGHLRSMEQIQSALAESFIQDVVYEGFARGNSVVKDQIKTIELCGAIQMACILKEKRCTMQYPAKRTGYIPIAKAMMLAGGLTLEETHHAIDACAHALCFMDEHNLPWEKQKWMRRTFNE